MQATGRTRRVVNEQTAEITGTDGVTVNAAVENANEVVNEVVNEAENNIENKQEEIQQNAEQIKDDALKNMNDAKLKGDKRKREANDKVRGACCCFIY